MPLPPAHQQISESDFEAIESAVKETARGRWFLEEFAQRNRNADTVLVLEAIQRLQRSVLGAEPAAAPAPQIIEGASEISRLQLEAEKARAEISEIERKADKTRAALSEIDAARLRDGDLGRELGGIVMVQAQAISEILSDADRIAEISSTMRTQGIAENICDQLDGLTMHINTACAFQDLTGQRTQKVVVALRALEVRVATLVRLWQAESKEQAPAKDSLLNGPARNGEGMEQEQIDELLSIDQDHDVFWNEKAAAASGTAQAKPVEAATAETPSALPESVSSASTAQMEATPVEIVPVEATEIVPANVEIVEREIARIEIAKNEIAPEMGAEPEALLAETPQMQTAPLTAAPSDKPAKRPGLETLTADERLALFA